MQLIINFCATILLVQWNAELIKNMLYMYMNQQAVTAENLAMYFQESIDRTRESESKMEGEETRD